MTRRNRLLAVGILMLLAVGVRIGAMITLRAWENPGTADNRQIALNLLGGEGFSFNEARLNAFGPTSRTTPLYPVLLAGLFHQFGTESDRAYQAAMTLNALLAGVGVAALFLLVRQIGGSDRQAVAASGLLAVWPTQVYAATFVQGVSAGGTFLLLSAILFRACVRGGARPAFAAGLGLTLGVGMLTEPMFLPVALLTLAALLRPTALPRRTRLQNTLVAAAVMLVVVGPWTYRNVVVHRAPVVLTTGLWGSLWQANLVSGTGTPHPPLPPQLRAELPKKPDSQRRSPDNAPPHPLDRLTVEQRARLVGQNEVERDRVFRDLVIEWVRSSPGQYLGLSLNRLGTMLWVDRDDPKSHHPVNIVSRSLLLALTPAGLILAIRRRYPIGYPMMIWAMVLLAGTLGVASARLAMLIEPWQLLLIGLLLGGAPASRPQPSPAGDPS